ncbi:MAG: CPBP family intramembrane glutamic endopeptidase [Cytophagaceae bacterium]
MADKILILGLGTLLFFGLGGVLIIEYIQGVSFATVLLRGWSIPMQLATGIVYGLICAGICVFIITRDFFKEQRKFYSKMVGKFDLTIPNIIIVSLCAGIGEEIFFRAAIQPFIGVWPTAIIFVFIHGYLNPKNWRISIYGSVMVVFMAGIGYLFQYTGLITVMVAHAVIDIVLFFRLMRER